jgi:hypothetical protein
MGDRSIGKPLPTQDNTEKRENILNGIGTQRSTGPRHSALDRAVTGTSLTRNNGKTPFRKMFLC